MAQHRPQGLVGEPGSRPHVVEHGHPVVDLLVLLGVVAEACLGAEGDFAQVGGLHPGKDAEQGGLPGPVEPDQEHPLPPLHGEFDVDEDQVVTKRLGQTGGG